jgi:hypothetical protein
MKRLLLLTIVFVFAFSLPIFAQIPNAGFEAWTNASPDNWFTNNIPSLWSPVTKSTTAHGGSASARLDVITVVTGGAMAPLIAAGTDMGGFAWTQRSGFISGYYQLSPASGTSDRISILGSLMKGGANGAGVAIGGGYVSTATSTWTQFSVPFTYITTAVPDWASLSITLVGAGSASAKAGTFCLIDDVSLTGTASGVNEAAGVPASFALGQNYPNPFNPSTKISYTIAQSGRVTLKVYNLLGTEVASLVDATRDAGTFMVNWNATGLPSGMYVYRMCVTSEKGIVFDQAKKLMLMK